MNNSDIDLEIFEQWTRHEPITWIEMLDSRPAVTMAAMLNRPGSRGQGTH